MSVSKPIAILGALAILVAMGFLISRTNPGGPADEAGEASGSSVTIGNVEVRVSIADSFDERAQGLSGHPGLGPREGLLFIFPEDGFHSFWMKDMLFSIDMLWISKDGEVVHIEKNAAPESYPASFTPGSPARYVLEVPAGFAEEHSITVGSKMQIR